MKKAAVRVGRKVLGMQDEAAPRTRAYGEAENEGAGVIPKVVQGSGDTPGPNHKTDIGRTWVAAQLLGGEGITVLDVRSSTECASGGIPGALHVPAPLVASHLDLIPGRHTDQVVAVVDAVGEADADADRVAGELRDAGWPRARRLVGGWAEWIEEGEVVETREPLHRWPIGASVDLPDGRAGIVWRVEADGPEPSYRILVDSSESVVYPQGELAK